MDTDRRPRRTPEADGSATAVLLDRLAADPTLEPLPDVDGGRPAALRRLLRPRWVNAALAVLLLAAGAGVWAVARHDSSTASSTTRTTTVRRAALTATVSGTGNLASATSGSVGFSTSGTITSIPVKVGQKVAKGQILATVDQADAKAALLTARAQLETTQAQYSETMAGATSYARRRAALQLSSSSESVGNARDALADAKAQYAADKKSLTAALAKARAAHDATATSQAQDKLTQTLAADSKAIDNAEQQVGSAQNQYEQQELSYEETTAGPTAAQIAQARSQLRSAKTSVADAQDALDATVLRAPRAGTVVAVAAQVGDTVSGGGSSSASSSSGSSSGSGTSGAAGTGAASSTGTSSTSSGVLTLTDLATLEVTASIAEADAQSVKVGQAATVTLSAASARYPAKVSAVSVVGTTSSNVVTYPVTVTLTEVPESVLLGASASVSITTASAADALVVTSSAVTTIGNRHTVTVLKDGVETVTPVEVGISGDSGTQITSGVSEGATLVIPTTVGGTGTANLRGVPGGGFGGGFGR